MSDRGRAVPGDQARVFGVGGRAAGRRVPRILSAASPAATKRSGGMVFADRTALRRMVTGKALTARRVDHCGLAVTARAEQDRASEHGTPR